MNLPNLVNPVFMLLTLLLKFFVYWHSPPPGRHTQQALCLAVYGKYGTYGCFPRRFPSKWKERSCPSVPSRRIRSLRKKRRRIPRSSPGSCLLSLHARRPSPAARPSYTSRKYCSTKRCGAVILCLTHIYTMFRCLARSFSIRFPDPPHSGRAGMPHSHTPITGVWYVLPCYAVS